MVMEYFFLGFLAGAFFMFVWGCVVGVLGPRSSIVVHHIDAAESNRQASAAYAAKRCADYNYMTAALKDD
jgi:hypothetical protein